MRRGWPGRMKWRPVDDVFDLGIGTLRKKHVGNLDTAARDPSGRAALPATSGAVRRPPQAARNCRRGLPLPSRGNRIASPTADLDRELTLVRQACQSASADDILNSKRTPFALAGTGGLI